eukprot:3599805-Ditylum_brightwellii.AAC.1
MKSATKIPKERAKRAIIKPNKSQRRKQKEKKKKFSQITTILEPSNAHILQGCVELNRYWIQNAHVTGAHQVIILEPQ